MKLLRPFFLLLLSATLSLAGAGIGSITTSASGATFVPIATSGPATKVDLINDSGTALQVRLGGTGSTFVLATGVGYTITGIKALSQVEVRRADSSNTQVTISYTYANND